MITNVFDNIKHESLEIAARNKRTISLKEMYGVILFSFVARHITLSGRILCRIQFVIHSTRSYSSDDEFTELCFMRMRIFGVP